MNSSGNKKSKWCHFLKKMFIFVFVSLNYVVLCAQFVSANPKPFTINCEAGEIHTYRNAIDVRGHKISKSGWNSRAKFLNSNPHYAAEQSKKRRESL